MIATLTGKVAQVAIDRVVIEVGGIGFEVMAPLGVLEEASKVESLRLFTYLHVREDALTLYGFTRPGDRDAFERLIGVSGIGPKTALAILSVYPADRLSQIIRSGDPSGFKGVPGVGPKTVGRLMLELQGKLTPGSAAVPAFFGETPADDSVAALVTLGYSQSAAAAAVERVKKENENLDTSAIVRQALRLLSGA